MKTSIIIKEDDIVTIIGISSTQRYSEIKRTILHLKRTHKRPIDFINALNAYFTITSIDESPKVPKIDNSIRITYETTYHNN